MEKKPTWDYKYFRYISRKEEKILRQIRELFKEIYEDILREIGGRRPYTDLSDFIEFEIEDNHVIKLELPLLRRFYSKELIEPKLISLFTELISQLTELRVLKLNGVPLVYLPESIRKLTQLEVLGLSNTQLIGLPDWFIEYNKLKSLDLGGNRLKYLPEEISDLSQLERLILSSNQLQVLPLWINQLTKLKILNLSNNQIQSLPDSFNQLTSLEILNLSYNRFKELPEWIGQLTNLKTLDLWGNLLIGLPESICQLIHLKELSLTNNQLKTLPTSFGHLNRLYRLDLNNNQLETIPETFGQLKLLTSLNIINNKLKTLPESFGQLSQLTILDLSKNTLTSLPESMKYLLNLERLYLANNKLKYLPNWDGQLKRLKKFYINKNKLNVLPDWIGLLSNLEVFDFSENLLTSLPDTFGQLKRLEEYKFHGNSIEYPPPEILGKGFKAIQAYFSAREKKQRFRAKIVLVGEGGVGKTSLRRNLRGEKHRTDEGRTEGIDIIPYTMKHPHFPKQIINYTFWDFAGQEIYFSTHQFFLTLRSIYLLVWDSRANEITANLEYWLNIINIRAPDMPIILVGTKIDTLKGVEPFNQYDFWKKRFPNIKGQIFISNSERNPEKTEELWNRILKCTLTLDHIGELWPKSWLVLEQGISIWKKKSVFYKWKPFLKECNNYLGRKKITEKLDLEIITRIMHEEGTVLYYSEIPVLKDLVILKPNWVTYNVGIFLLEAKRIHKNGLIPFLLRDRIWTSSEFSEYPVLCEQLVQLMISFDLCYKYDKSQLLIPLYLDIKEKDPPSEGEDWEFDSSQTTLTFRYSLNIIPIGLFSRFIVRTRRFSLDFHWRYGVYLKDPLTEDIAKVYMEKNQIIIHVKGLTRLSFLTKLRTVFEDIFSFYMGLKIERAYQCICNGDKNDHNCTHFYKMKTIRVLVKQQKELICPETGLDVPLSNYIAVGSDLIRSLREELREVVQEAMQNGVGVLSAEIQRSNRLSQQFFLQIFNQVSPELPNLFYFVPVKSKDWNRAKKLIDMRVQIIFICQYEDQWHPITGHSDCQIVIPKGSLVKAYSWFKRVIKIGKTILPFGRALVEFGLSEEDWEKIKKSSKLIQETITLLDQTPKSSQELEIIEADDENKVDIESLKEVDKDALISIQSLLPKNCWKSNVFQYTTPEGQIVWVCEHHHKVLQEAFE
ncbi:MAG: leucine-rich repeat domain-containing protein [Candidatus Thorarchaeota archaeon]